MINKIAICDDETKYSSKIFSFIERFQIQYDLEFETSIFSSSRDLLNAYTTPNSFDILFLDVEMPEIDGLKLASTIRKLPDYHVKIVFISNFIKYMQNSFNVEAFQFLHKPLTYGTFEKVMLQILSREKLSQKHKLYVSYNNMKHVINLHEILYIETVPSKERTLQIHLHNETITVHDTLTKYEKSLSPLGFAVPYRGILVNLDYIHYIHENEIILTNEESIPLSRRKERTIHELFSKRIVTIRSDI